jgi:Tfp pilus assembly protein PilX
MTSKRSHTQPRESGAALVVTLIVTVVLSMVVVAFMQNTTVDRSASASLLDAYQARLAAQSGLSMAKASLVTNTTNDTFIVVANPGGQLFVGQGVPGSQNFSYAPLFSSVQSLAATVEPVVTNKTPTITVSDAVVFTNVLPGGLSITSPPVSWFYLTNASGQTNARFAYWVEDLSGRLDLGVAGSVGSVARRPTGTNPAELALWSLFNSNAASDVNNASVGKLLAARPSLFTAATARLAEPQLTTNMLADVAVGLRYDTNEPDLIPFGFGYEDEGKPKYNLNTNLSPDGVTRIPEIINRNLPEFGGRGGGMSPSEYLQNIAANIVDYGDADSTPTIGGGNPPTYRGIEAIAWPNEVFMRLEFSAEESEDGTAFDCELTVRQAVELWNLSDKQVDTEGYSIFNNLDIPLSVGNWRSSLASLDSGQPPRDEVFGAEGTLAPNSYVVLLTDERTFKFSIPFDEIPHSPGGPAPRLGINVDGSGLNNKYTISKAGLPIDAITGSRFLDTTNIPSGQPHIICSASAFGTTGDGSRYNLAAGDPRGQLFIGPPTWTYAWNRSTPGGRNFYSDADGGARIVDPPVNWPDGGHSLGDSGADTVPSPSGDSWGSLDGKGSSGDPNHWLQKTGDKGNFVSVTELGNIFDPIQWGGTFSNANPFHRLDTAAWLELLASDATFPSDVGAGRNTLRIGRAEHARFATNGLRASQLLDLFTVSPTNSITGRININTASTNVLRALGAGVTHEGDKALQPGGTNFVPTAAAVSAFVAAATNFRAQVPFFSPAQLSTIPTNTNASEWPTNAVFGNTNLGGATVRWSDVAAEEWFAKILPLTTVRSRNFLVHGVGQALDPKTLEPLASSKQLAMIYCEPVRDPNTRQATNSVPVVLQAWEL